MVKVSTQQTQEQFYSKQGLSKTMGVGGGGGGLGRRGRKTLSLLMKKQHWFWPVKYLMFSFSAYSSLLCKPPPLKTLITAVCTLQRDRKTSQLGDLPPGAIFSNRSQERSWKSWEALGDTCGHISVPFLKVLEVLRRPRQTNSKAVPCILQVTEGFFPLVT